MSKNMTASRKRRRVETKAEKGDCSPPPDSTSEETWIKELAEIENVKTRNSTDLKLIQQVLLDIHEARHQLGHLTELVTADKENQLETEIVAEKVAATAKKLENIHDYLMGAFENPMEVVLHKAQYGQKRFDLDMLPDYVIGKIISFLDFQDKKNMREVAPRLAEVILWEDCSLRHWTINVDKENVEQVSRHLETAKSKGITALHNFKLHFKTETEKSTEVTTLVKTWQENICGLEIALQPSLSTLHMPKLEILKFSCWKINRIGFSSDAAAHEFNELIKIHAPNLKILKMTGLGSDSLFPDDEVMPQFTKLRSLGLKFIHPEDPELFELNMCKNITRLNIEDFMTFKELSDASLQFPALKHLTLRGFNSFKFLKANAQHLESLYIKKNKFLSIFETTHIPLPESLPNLKTFVFLAPDLYVLQEILDACENSVEQVVMCSPKHGNVSDHEMKALKRLVFVDKCMDEANELFEFMLAPKSPSVEHVTIFNLQDNSTLWGLNNVCKRLAHLKRLDMFADEFTLLEPFRKHENKFRLQIPSAEVQLQRRSFKPFLKSFLKTHCGK